MKLSPSLAFLPTCLKFAFLFKFCQISSKILFYKLWEILKIKLYRTLAMREMMRFNCMLSLWLILDPLKTLPFPLFKFFKIKRGIQFYKLHSIYSYCKTLTMFPRFYNTSLACLSRLYLLLPHPYISPSMVTMSLFTGICGPVSLFYSLKSEREVT